MRSSREVLLTTTLLGAVVAALACSDAPAAPTTVAQADTTRFASMSTRELLLTVLDRLDALEARAEREALAARVRLDSALARGGLQAAPGTQSAGLGREASICVTQEFKVDAKMESKVRMSGAGAAGAGVDAYGNGAVAAVGLQAMQELHFVPEGNDAIQLEVCGKMGMQRVFEEPAASGGATRVAAAPRAAGPAEQLLTAALQALPPEQLAAVAQTLRMDGSRLRQGLDLVSGFSLSDLPFGRGAAASWIDALPLPSDIANLVQHPENLVQKAGEAGQYAIDRMCDQTLFTGEFAQRASQACDLRDEVPSAAELIDILDGLEGLPETVSDLDERLSSACTTVRNELVSQSVVIPQTDITKGVAVVGQFPQTTISPFSGLGRIC